MISKTYLSDNTLTHEQALVPALNGITSKQTETVAAIARASEAGLERPSGQRL